MTEQIEHDRPDFYIALGYGDTYERNPGAISDQLRTDGGWLDHVALRYGPWIDWATSDGHTVGVVVDRPFGHWRPGYYNDDGDYLDQYELDSYDWATSSGQSWITEGFTKAWRVIANDHRVLAYCGNVAGHASLASLAPLEMAKMIRRNMRPFEAANFHHVIIDTGAYAITFEHHNAAGLLRPRTVESFTLMTVDNMKFARTAVEPMPPNHASYAGIWTRDVHIAESIFQQYHNRTPEADEAADDGYSPDLQYVSGTIHRYVLAGYLPEGQQSEAGVVARCVEVVADGHVPVVAPWYLIGHHTPADFLGPAD